MAVAKNVIDLAGTVLLCLMVPGDQHVHLAVTSHVIAGHESSLDATAVSKALPCLGDKRLAAQGTVRFPVLSHAGTHEVGGLADC